jgi:ligand-binding SRPBCC domain-containing protein
MKTYTLLREQFVARPREEVFAFFEHPENLAKITPPSLGFLILTPSPVMMKSGALIDYTIKVFGIRQHWRTYISHYDPPHRFVDEQLKGPYTFWHHTHSFEAAEGGTMIRDEVRYLMPFGPIGRLVNALVVRGQLKRIFDYRAGVIAKLFE